VTTPVIQALTRLVAVIADEARRNSEFAARLTAALALATDSPGQAQRVSDAKPNRRGRRRAPSVMDPITVMERGEAALRSALADLDIEQLKDVVAEHGMDTSKLALKWKSRERLEGLIVSTVRDRLAKGDVFRREV
jgi:hypothetical protein